MPTSVPDCPFCEIAARADPDVREIFRDDQVVAFFPLEPATLGHTLVIPRCHAADIWELEPAVAGHIAEVAVRLAHAIKRAIEPEGLNVIQSNGEVATQTVMHFHTHVVPRWRNDALGRIWPPESHYTEQQKDDAWERLRDECRRLMTGDER